MWLFKLLFLLALIASWIPLKSQGHAGNFHPPEITIDFDLEEEQEEEELEEEVVV